MPKQETLDGPQGISPEIPMITAWKKLRDACRDHLDEVSVYGSKSMTIVQAVEVNDEVLSFFGVREGVSDIAFEINEIFDNPGVQYVIVPYYINEETMLIFEVNKYPMVTRKTVEGDRLTYRVRKSDLTTSETEMFANVVQKAS